MKNTNKKTILLELVAAVLVIGVIGAVIGLFTNGLKGALDAFDNAFGSLQTGEADTSSDTSTDSSDTSEDTIVSDDSKITLAENEVKTGFRADDYGYSCYSVSASDLKANTKYKISWSIDSIYGTYGFYFTYVQVDGVYTPCVISSLSPSFDATYNIVPSESKESYLLNYSYEFTTDSNGYIEIILLRTEIDSGSDAAYEQI